MTAPLSPEDFARATNVSRETLARLETYAALLSKFQKAVNLVGPETLADPWRRHFLDSAQVFPMLPPIPPDRPMNLLDLGSGAGFPGLVLAILGAGAGQAMTARLVESDTRKAAFLREVARQTETAVTIENKRLEDIHPSPVDVITARAFAPLPRLLALAAPFLGPPAPILLLHKGRHAQEELTRAGEGWKITAASIPSIIDPESVVLRIEDIKRV